MRAKMAKSRRSRRAVQGRGGRGGQCGEEDAVDCGVVRWAAATALGNKLVDACHRE